MSNEIKKRLECFELIDKVVSLNNLKVNEVSFGVMRQTGFTERFILNYINKKVALGFWKLKKNGIIKLNPLKRVKKGGI